MENNKHISTVVQESSGVTACGSAMDAPFAIKPLTGTALNYADKSNWMVYTEPASATHEVDLFYLYPTCAMEETCKTAIVENIDEKIRRMAQFSFDCDGKCLADFTNAYAPYYRQVSFVGISQVSQADAFEQMCRESVVRTDVYAALDYFFEHVNKRKPFIFAGHSQGSCNLKIALAEYMRAHPEYLQRMIACYAIGFYFPESWFEANPHIKKAQGETDTQVLISWNSEGPGATKNNWGYQLDATDFFVTLNAGWDYLISGSRVASHRKLNQSPEQHAARL